MILNHLRDRAKCYYVIFQTKVSPYLRQQVKADDPVQGPMAKLVSVRIPFLVKRQIIRRIRFLLRRIQYTSIYTRSHTIFTFTYLLSLAQTCKQRKTDERITPAYSCLRFNGPCVCPILLEQSTTLPIKNLAKPRRLVREGRSIDQKLHNLGV